MIKSIIFFLLIAPLVQAEEQLVLDPPFERQLIGTAPETGSFWVSLCKDQNGANFGPILIWRNKKTNASFEVRDLAALEEICRQETAALDSPKEEQIIQIILNVFYIFLNSRNDCLVLTPEVTNHFKTALKSHVTPSEYSRFETLLTPGPSQLSRTAWEFSLLLVTSRNALERRTISGTFAPFSIKESREIIIAPSGSIPKFTFSP